MSNVRGSTRAKKKEGKISLKSNCKINKTEQEKIKTELTTSGEEEGEKQHGETGVVQTKTSGKKEKVREYFRG